MNQQITFFRGIDGLRAIAAIAVIFFHVTRKSFLHIGWTGVDLFFTISGFLITNILINQKNSANYFQNFYARRALRIFPLYFFVVLPILIVNIYTKGFNLNVLSYIFYFQNFTGIDSGYLPMLDHTWSLAIEEQFYLVFPFIIYITPVNKLKSVLIFLIILSISARVYFAHSGLHIYYQSTMLLSRADSLLMGGLLPVFYLDTPRMIFLKTLKKTFLVALILLIVFLLWQVSVFGYENIFQDFGNNNLESNYFGQFKFSILALIFASLIGFIAYGNSNKILLVQNCLEINILKYLGKISYGLYLYHYPILTLSNYFFLKFGIVNYWYITLSVNLIATILVSALSWKYFEKPILKLKSRFSYS